MFPNHFINKIILTENLPEHLSLKHGLMGKILFFFKMAEHSGNSLYREYASDLMQELLENSFINSPINFIDGLAGIGWCIQYIVSLKLEEGDTNEILEELDKKIMEYDPARFKDLSFENGLSGIIAYVRSRIDLHGFQTSFDDTYLRTLKEICLQKGLDFNNKDFCLETTYQKILNHFESLPEKKQMPWEKGLLLLESRKTKIEDYHYFPLNDQSGIKKSNTPCALIFTQTSRAGNYGIGTYVEQLVQCLKSTGWNICVFELDCQEKDAGIDIIDGIRYYKISQKHKNVNLKQYNYAQFVIQNLYKKSNLFVCHFNFAFYPLMVEKIRYALNAKVVFTLHFTSWSFELAGDKKLLMNILSKQNNDKEKHVYRTFLDERNFMIEHCDHVIAIAKHSYDMLIDIYGIPKEKLHLIPNGRVHISAEKSTERMHVLRQKYGFKETEKIMVFCGRLDAIKGVVNLIDAFRVLSQKIENIRLIIIGEGNFNVCLKCAEGLWSKITFTGFLEKKTIKEIYELADFGVVPSLHEEFGYVALEMMMSGLPIIANNSTGLKELTNYGNDGLLYNGFSSEEDGFVTTLEKVLLGSLSIPKPNQCLLDTKYSIVAFRNNIIELYKSL